MNLLRRNALPIITPIIGVLFLFRSLNWAKVDTTLWADNYDSKLIYWIANWGYHVLVELGQPSSFWHANSFFPHPYSLAFSDGLLGLQPLFAPLRILGLQPLTALYLSLALLCLLGAWLTNIALIRIGTFSAIERATIIYAAHFGLPMINFLVHYQLFGVQLAIPFLLFQYLYLKEWKRSDLIMTVLIGSWGMLIATYLAPLLATFTLMLCLYSAIKLTIQGNFWTTINQQFKAIIFITIPVAAFLYLVQFHAYFAVFGERQNDWLNEATLYSAYPFSLLDGFSENSLIYRFKSGDPWFGAGERAYFPGITLLAMSTIAAILWVRADRKLREIGAFSLIVLGTALVMSWGPLYRFDQSIKLPFFYLAEIIPGLSSIRTPGRFGMVIGLPLSLLAVIALRELRPVRNMAFSTLLFVLIVAESFSTFKTYNFIISPLYNEVGNYLDDSSHLVELPIADSNDLKFTSNIVNQLVGSTKHWGKMVIGYGAIKTEELRELIKIDLELQTGKVALPALLKFATRLGINRLLIHMPKYPKTTRVRIRQLIKSNEAVSVIKRINNSYLIQYSGAV